MQANFRMLMSDRVRVNGVGGWEEGQHARVCALWEGVGESVWWGLPGVWERGTPCAWKGMKEISEFPASK